ncbi:MAG TPA: TonB family protein [Polyangia bacterium]|nr:TonB family protein [Polyangia bacterium]
MYSSGKTVLRRLQQGAAFVAALGLGALAWADEPAPPAAAAPAPQLTKPPKLVKFVEAAYPEAEKAAGRATRVTLGIDIAADGRVTDVRVVQSAGAAFDAAAVEAARRFVFEPAEIDHQPAPVKITYRYDFTLRVEKVKLGPQVNFEGAVIERLSQRKLAGVRVALVDLGVEAVTGEDGGFAFVDVPPGPHRVALSGKDLIAVTAEEVVAPGKKKTVRYFVEEKLDDVDEEVVIRAPRIRRESVETVIRTEEARLVPGTQGDTLKVVQNLPGVARSAFGSGQLVVWGSAPGDTRVLIDGVEIPALYHLGGLRSTLNSDLVKTVDLTPGGFGADYGNGLGGLVRIETRDLPKAGVHGYVGADLLDTSGMLQVALGRRVRLAMSGRYSYLDRLLPLFTSADVGDFVPIPRYYDYQAQLTVDLRKDEELTALYLASSDRLRRTIASSDPAEVRSENTETSYDRALVRYRRLFDDGSSFILTPSFGRDTNRLSTSFGAVPAAQTQVSWRYGVRAAYRRRVNKLATLSLGLDFQGARSRLGRVGSVTLPPREGDVSVFGQPPGDDVAVDHWRTHIVSAAPYAFVELQLGPLTLVPGARLGIFAIEGDRLLPASGIPPVGYSRLQWALDPRLQASLRATKRLTLNATVGYYHQPPDPRDLSSVFGNPRLGLQASLHTSLGAQVKLTGTLSLEAVGFYKGFYDLVSRSAAPTPPLATALTQDGTGRSYGGQLLLRQELFKGFFGWVSYSYVRSERRDHPTATSALRRFDYDQPHVLAILGSYTLKWGITVGARFRYAAGYPRTPVVGSLYNARSDQYEPIFGAQNAIRLPGFYQLDVRVEKSFPVKSWSINVYLDVQNVTNRQNPEEFIYNYDYTVRRTISGLPTLAVLGVRLERL